LIVVLNTDFIKQSGGGKKMPTRTIAELSAMKTDDIEDHYYPPTEYSKLLNSQKEALKRKRKAQGNVPASLDSNVRKNHEVEKDGQA
jgi:ATP-dependent exoDNAse (exonuclease V) alpha subunit